MSVCVLSYFSHVWLFATLWTVAHQAPLSMGFSRQEYYSGIPTQDQIHISCIPDTFFTQWATWKAPDYTQFSYLN